MFNSCREVINDNDLLAGVNQRMCDVAADVSRATCYKDCHRWVLTLSNLSSKRASRHGALFASDITGDE